MNKVILLVIIYFYILVWLLNATNANKDIHLRGRQRIFVFSYTPTCIMINFLSDQIVCCYI